MFMKEAEKGKKIERIEVDYDFEDNDASYSAFGWDFQVNAGIFLFLRFIKEADSTHPISYDPYSGE